MAFPRIGLACLPMLFLFFSQGNPRCSNPLTNILIHIEPSCCTSVSNQTINKAVDACYVQRDTTFSHCRISAYIFTVNEEAWCVDPRAPWLKKRLRKLEKRGIYCRVL
ncbi:unnamed protein product [Menidia menidia]|uniref:(Atlantic silverside) hypothetical protein n=1 Tax=Menidia menidia TaxID=238744 RepID=A0A8S4B3X4_9TELE|nr:unnamed protein product [Menidia menidia]